MGRARHGREGVGCLSPRVSICFHFMPTSAGWLRRSNWAPAPQQRFQNRIRFRIRIGTRVGIGRQSWAWKRTKVGGGSASAVALTFPLRSAFWPHASNLVETFAPFGSFLAVASGFFLFQARSWKAKNFYLPTTLKQSHLINYWNI